MAAIPKQEPLSDPIAQVKATVRIEDYATGKMGLVPTKKSRNEWWFLCPFHKESTASFHIRLTEQDFRCFGCGAGLGDVIDLEMRATGETNPRIAAEHILAEYGQRAEPVKRRSAYANPAEYFSEEPIKIRPLRAPVTVREPEEDDPGLAWLAERGISAEVAGRNLVGTGRNKYGRLAVQFVYVYQGKIVNRQTRGLKLPAGGKKPFDFEDGADVIPFGYDDCAGRPEFILVEGVMDKLAIEEATRRTDVLAMPSATPGEKAYGLLADLAKGATKIVLAVDADTAGETFKAELIRRLGADLCWLVTWPEGCKDANDVLMQHGGGRLQQCLDQAMPMPVDGVFTIEESWDQIERLYLEGLPAGISTGWPLFDRYYTGRKRQLTVITGTPGSGKALATTTPIPTPFGWTTMGEVQVGDWVFGEDGLPVQVVRATEVMSHRPCYRVTFSDNAQIVCDADHQWVTRDDKARQSAVNAARSGRAVPRAVALRGTDQSYLRTFPSAKTTREIAGSVWAENGLRANHSVAVAGPLMLGDAELPIDPYVLGAWLGDGHSYWANITCADQEIIDEIERRGHHCTKHSTRYEWGIANLKTPLRLAGLLQNKHVPERYFRASESQRLDLLRGLMDTDGHATRQGTCEFTSTNAELAGAVLELVRSLGMVPTMSTERARLYGKDCGPKYRVRFRPLNRVFWLARKHERCQTPVRPSCGFRRIMECVPVDSVPVKCIQVDSESHQYLCGREMIPTHNSVWTDALLMNWATGPAGWKFAICSPEMQPLERHWAHLIGLWAGKPFGRGPRERLDRETLRQAKEFLGDRFLMVLPEEPTVDAVIERMLWTHRRYGVDGWLLDPWNEMDHSRPNGMTMTEYCNNELRKIKRVLQNHDVWGGLIAHPTKLYRQKADGKYPVPTLYDIADSAAFFNKADNGIVLVRDKEDDNQPVQVHVQKVRFAEIGGLGMQPFGYDRATGRYVDAPAGASQNGGW